MDAVYRLSFAILGNEADARDAAQETFVAAWKQIERVRDSDRFDAWLQRVAVNAARMVHRSRRRRGVREIPSVQVATRVEAMVASDGHDASLLDHALQRLPIDQRELLVLHHLEGQPVAALAEVLGIPAGTVKSRLHTARSALQQALVAEVER